MTHEECSEVLDHIGQIPGIKSNILDEDAPLPLFLLIHAKAGVSASGTSVGIAVPRRVKVATIARDSLSSLKAKDRLRIQMS